jgi:ectoine hydroxylase-related dioxygenase (phytanoyl-CoA dioxygenase family)
MLTQTQKDNFERDGFLVLEHVIPTDMIDTFRAEGERLAAEDALQEPRRTWHERALFRRPAFRKILDATALIDAQRALLGDDVQLLALDLLLVRPQSGNIGWHRDVSFVCNKTLSINTGIYLQDMTPEMGLLYVWPGSHRREEWRVIDNVCPDRVAVQVQTGSAVLFDAGLWHSGDRNASASRNRMALFPYFGKYFVKRMDAYFTQPLPAELAQTPDPLKRQLLGLGLQAGAPNYHGDDPGYNRRGEPGIDFVLDS